MQTLNGTAADVGFTGNDVVNAPVAMPRGSDILFSASLAGLIGLSVTLITGVDSLSLSVILLDLSGLLFLIVSAAYRGGVRMWWLGLAPLSFLLLMGPVAFTEAKSVGTPLGHLLRSALVPGLSFLGGNLLATFRDTLFRSRELTNEIGGLEAKLIAHALDLRKIGEEMTDMMGWISKNEIPSRFKHLNWSPVEYSLAPQVLEPESNWGRIDYKSLENLVSIEVDRLSSELTDPSKIQVRLVYPREVPIPIETRGSAQVLRSVLRGILIQALDSLVAGEGVIRVNIRLGMSSVFVSIEDNGRGLNETFILKLQEKGILPRSNGRWDLKSLRQAAEESGWRFEMQARLGVGARVILELPRVDAFAYGAKARRNRFTAFDSGPQIQGRSS